MARRSSTSKSKNVPIDKIKDIANKMLNYEYPQEYAEVATGIRRGVAHLLEAILFIQDSQGKHHYNGFSIDFDKGGATPKTDSNGNTIGYDFKDDSFRKYI